MHAYALLRVQVYELYLKMMLNPLKHHAHGEPIT